MPGQPGFVNSNREAEGIGAGDSAGRKANDAQTLRRAIDFAPFAGLRRIPTTCQLALGLALGIGFLWLSMRHLDPHDVLAVILGADVSWLTIAFVLYAANMAVRVQRWRMLLCGHDNLSYGKVGAVLISGYGINFLLPARIGELFRMELMRRRHSVPRVVAFSGIVIERILDGLCLVVLLGIGLWATGQSDEHSKVLKFVNVSGALIFGGAVVGWVLFRKLPLTRAFSAWPRVIKGLDLLQQSFSAVAGKRLLLMVGLTGIVYANEAGALWAICRALELNLGLPELLVLVGVSALSTLVPSAPGFVGTFQMAFVLTFAQYNQSSTLAVAAATLAQLVLFGPLIVAAVPSLLYGSISFDDTLAPRRGGERTRGASAERRPSRAQRNISAGLVRRGAAIMLLLTTVFASRHVGQVSFAPNQEWWRSIIGLLHNGRGLSALGDLVTSNSGEQVLPPLVREMLALLRQRDILEYALSPQIAADLLLNQRIIESAFPRRVVPTAPYLLARVGEQLPPKCGPLAVEMGIQLAWCD
jgi:uncharacterized membrane protein YbhN (UPF0104 family)